MSLAPVARVVSVLAGAGHPPELAQRALVRGQRGRGGHGEPGRRLAGGGDGAQGGAGETGAPRGRAPCAEEAGHRRVRPAGSGGGRPRASATKATRRPAWRGEAKARGDEAGRGPRRGRTAGAREAMAQSARRGGEQGGGAPVRAVDQARRVGTGRRRAAHAVGRGDWVRTSPATEGKGRRGAHGEGRVGSRERARGRLGRPSGTSGRRGAGRRGRSSGRRRRSTARRTGAGRGAAPLSSRSNREGGGKWMRVGGGG